MNLLDRIDQRLNDMRVRIHALDFEDCATSLLMDIYQGLVPITGGTDFGVDAEVSLDGKPVGLIITSSRTLQGARASLRKSLRSMTKKQVPIRHVIAVNLAEVNRLQREKLKALAGEYECELIQVHDRQYFANAFRKYPDWRLKILNIAGGAFCLSREPRGCRPGHRALPSIGRDDLLAAAAESSGDLILEGMPGTGKTHVAARLPGAVFLEDDATPERLLDDLISADPAVVVIDDAGARLPELKRLQHVRRAETLRFRIALTCWPHETETIRDHLPDAQVLEVDLLTREEIGQLVREQGITRVSLIARLLDQAQGRPAWALNLCDLIVREGDWRSVWSGAAVRSQILSYLRRSGTVTDAVELLGAISLLGDVDEQDARRLGRAFQIPPIQFTQLLRSVSVAGLVDVQRVTQYTGRVGEARHEDHFQVVPPVIAASVAAETFFAGRAPAISLEEVQEAFPEKLPQILQVQIHCGLVGAEEPVLPTTETLAQALTLIATRDAQDELLRSYALLGPGQAVFVMGWIVNEMEAELALGRANNALRYLKVLAARVADQVHSNHFETRLHKFFEAVTMCTIHGIDVSAALTALVEEIRDARSGEPPEPADIRRFAKALADQTPRPETLGPWLQVVKDVLTPTFDGNYLSPEIRNQFVLQSFIWPAATLTELFNELRPSMRHRLPNCTAAQRAEMLDLLGDWVHLAQGYPLHFGMRPDEERMAACNAMAAELAQDLKIFVNNSPGLRARFNERAAHLGLALPEPDALFGALSKHREVGVDWRTQREQQEVELLAALKPFLDREPNNLVGWLAAHQVEFELADRTNNPTLRVVWHLREQPNPEGWLAAMLEHDLLQHTASMVAACVYADTLDVATTQRLLNDPRSRASVIAPVITEANNPDIVDLVLGQLSKGDMTSLDPSFAIRSAPPRVRSRLFTHPDPDIRGHTAALWAAESAYENESPNPDPRDDPAWEKAMSDFSIPSALSDHMQSEALKQFARNAPDAYIDLLSKHAHLERRFDDYDEWQESTQQLTHADRDRLWTRVRATRQAHELFWVIAGPDADWAEHIHATDQVDIDPTRLLHARRCQNSRAISVERLAAIFMPLGVPPEELLWLLEVGIHVGEEHEREAQHLERCQQWAASADINLARLGARGVEIYEPRLADARKRARSAATRNIHAF